MPGWSSNRSAVDEPGPLVEGDGAGVVRADHHVGGVAPAGHDLVEEDADQQPADASALPGRVDGHGQELGPSADPAPPEVPWPRVSSTRANPGAAGRRRGRRPGRRRASRKLRYRPATSVEPAMKPGGRRRRRRGDEQEGVRVSG